MSAAKRFICPRCTVTLTEDSDGGHRCEGCGWPAERPAASVDEPVPTETFGARVQEARRLWGEGDESALIAYLLNVPVEKVLSVRP